MEKASEIGVICGERKKHHTLTINVTFEREVTSTEAENMILDALAAPMMFGIEYKSKGE